MLFGPKGPFCQSCGMPLSKDPGAGGTNADGSKSTEYCSKCYAGGQFVDPSITFDQMKEKVLGRMKQMGLPKFLANYFVKDMANLKRWSGHN
jgi:hypothetical protein